MENNKLVGVLAVVALIVSGVTLIRSTNVNVTIPDINVPPAQVLGGSSGTEHTQTENFYAGMNIGTQPLVLNATTTVANEILTASQLCNTGFVKIDPPLGGANGTTTLTFPSSQNIQSACLTKDGMYKDFIVYNNSTTTLVLATTTSAGSTSTIALLNPMVSSTIGGVNGTGTLATLSLRSGVTAQAWVRAIRLPSVSYAAGVLANTTSTIQYLVTFLNQGY